MNTITSGAADVVLVDQSTNNRVINGSLVLSTGGSGYTSAPAVTIDAPTGSSPIQATAHAVLGTGDLAGQVVSIVLDNAGSGYTSAPTVTIDAPPAGGTIATAIAGINTTSHAVSGLSLTADGRTFTFVKTGLVGQNGLPLYVTNQGTTGSLLNPADTYQVTLVSGGRAFTTTAGGSSNSQLLVGNSGFASNYVTTFAGTSAVPSTSTVEVMIPDFARGPGNTNLNVPGDAQGTSVSGGVGSPTQTLAFGGTVTGGTFKLVFGGVTTDTISYNSDDTMLEANVTDALVTAVPSLDGHVSVTGSFPFYTISFDNTVTSPSQVTTNGMALLGTRPTLTTSMSIGVPVDLIIPSGVTNVTSGNFALNYNADLLSINGGTVNSNLAASNGLSFSVGTPSGSGANATVTISFTATTPLSPGSIRLGGLAASVPSGAAYKSKDLLHFSSVSLNDGISIVAADAVHVVADEGDAAGVGVVSGASAAPIAQIGSNTNKGLAAYLLTDPAIIADLGHKGTVAASDVTILNAFVSLATRLVIPTNAQASFRPASKDPTLSIPTNLTVGDKGIVTVPVNIDDPAPAGSTGMTDALLALTYDPQVFSVTPSDIHLGRVPAAGQDWAVHSTINATAGAIVIDVYSHGAPITSPQGGSLVTIDFHRTAAPASGTTPINLAEGVDPDGRGTVWTSVYDASGPYVLTPAPTNAADDAVDGSVILGDTLPAEPSTTPTLVAQTPAAMSVPAALAASNSNESARTASLLVQLGRAVFAIPQVAASALPQLPADRVFADLSTSTPELAGDTFVALQDEWLAQDDASRTDLANHLTRSAATDAELAAWNEYFSNVGGQ